MNVLLTSSREGGLAWFVMLECAQTPYHECAVDKRQRRRTGLICDAFLRVWSWCIPQGIRKVLIHYAFRGFVWRDGKRKAETGLISKCFFECVKLTCPTGNKKRLEFAMLFWVCTVDVRQGKKRNRPNLSCLTCRWEEERDRHWLRYACVRAVDVQDEEENKACF